MEKGKVLIFDYDGTIVDSLDVAFKAFNMLAKKYNLRARKIKEDFVKLYNNNLYESLVNEGLPKEKIQAFNKELRDLFLQNGYGPKLFNGIKEVVNRLAEKHKIIIITSNITSTIKKSVEKAGLQGISEIMGSDFEPSKVKKILEVKKFYPKAEIYYIGDTIGDIKEAKKAGVKAIGVSWGYHSRKMLEDAGAELVADKPNELLEIFE